MIQTNLLEHPRIAIVGTGAIGGYYGGKLAQHNNVHFFARSDVDHMRIRGLRVDSVDGDFVVNPVSTSTLEENVGTFDMVLVTLKTTQNASVSPLLPGLIHPNTIILVIQNGLNVEADFHQHLPNTRMVGGLAFICATKSGPGRVEHQDYGALKIGNFFQTDQDTLNQLCSLFETSGISCSVTPNLQLTRWEKLVWNIPFAGLCIQNNCTTQALLTDPTHRTHLKDLMLEVINTARSDGCELPDALADKMLTNTDNMVDYAPSTLLDFRAGSPIELNAIFREPLRVAQDHHVKTPRLNMLVENLTALTQ